MTKQLRIILAQLNFLVGDIEGNRDKIIHFAKLAKGERQADLIVFPELALTGYPPEDLLFRDGIYDRIHSALKSIQEAATDIDILLGHPVKEGKSRFNAASLISRGVIRARYHKMCLPNHGVFDEVRYFQPGDSPLVIDYHGIALGVAICEDLWHKQPLAKAVAAGAQLIISINASPFDRHKHETRIRVLSNRAADSSVPILYVNSVGGQDELVFDGGSLVLHENGHIDQRGPFYQESLIPVDISFDPHSNQITISREQPLPSPSQEARVYDALVLGVRDYIKKNNFSSALLGLSGGIDSALTLAIAVDAIGANRVHAVLMPSPYTSQLSIDEAQAQAKILNVKTSTIPIEKAFNSFLESLSDEFSGLQSDLTEQNLQARCRGTILMAISNKKGGIVLTTGNKSEISVGYCTLYGDMAGGFCVLKDISKTLVYKLAAYRNQISAVIPARVIDREPTAELAPNQRDQDFLPPYSILDQILELYIEKDQDYDQILAKGFDPEVVKKIIRLIDHNEYKRRQAPPGVRVTQRAFGRDRRYPITSGYNNYLQLKRS